MFKQVETLLPEKMGEEIENEENVDTSASISGYQKQISLKSPKSGYLQDLDSEALIEIITRHDAILELYYKPGEHLVEGVEIGLLFINDKWEDNEFKKIFNQFVIGNTKTSQQDLKFSIHQMVEIAARALSPGVNDPYTAITCIDNLTEIMCYLAQAKFPSKYRFDEEGNLRIIADTFNFEGILDSAFNQIRQFSGGSPAVIIKLMEALTTIYKFTSKESHKKAVIKHAEMVLNSGKQNFEERNDIDDITERAEKILNK